MVRRRTRFALVARSGRCRRATRRWRERRQHRVEEESEPRASPRPPTLTRFQAVVPVAAAHEREAVRAGRDALCRSRGRNARRPIPAAATRGPGVIPVASGWNGRTLEKRQIVSSTATIAGDAHVMSGGAWQPQRVVWNTGIADPGPPARATSAGRRPRRTGVLRPSTQLSFSRSGRAIASAIASCS